jgi:hypothetical protein
VLLLISVLPVPFDHRLTSSVSQVAMWTVVVPVAAAHIPATRNVPSVASVHFCESVLLQV